MFESVLIHASIKSVLIRGHYLNCSSSWFRLVIFCIHEDIIIIIILGSCIALMSVRFDPPGAPDYYPAFSLAAIRRSSISRN